MTSPDAGSAENGLPGGNLDLDFIDYPTGWAIQKRGLAHTDERCSAAQTGGAMLCDCNALPIKWAELKTAHDGSDGMALAAPYMRPIPPALEQAFDELVHETEEQGLYPPRPLPIHRTEAGYPRCSTCDGGGCLDCTDPA